MALGVPAGKWQGNYLQASEESWASPLICSRDAATCLTTVGMDMGLDFVIILSEVK